MLHWKPHPVQRGASCASRKSNAFLFWRQRRYGAQHGKSARTRSGSKAVSRQTEDILEEAASLPQGRTFAESCGMTPIVSRPSRKRLGGGWARALFGVVIVGALVVSLALVQRGILHLAPRDVAQPLPPLAAKVDQVYRGPIFVEPVPVRVVQTPMASEAAARADIAKSRPRLASATRRSNYRPAQHQVAEPDTKAPGPPVETCDGMEGMDLARCMRPQILEADLQLRTAYDEAARAGVKRRELAAHRRKWSKLRKRANSDPRGVLAGFREIAQQLDAARAAHLLESECQLPGGACAVPDDR